MSSSIGSSIWCGPVGHSVLTSCWDPLFSSCELFCWLLMLVIGHKGKTAFINWNLGRILGFPQGGDLRGSSWHIFTSTSLLWIGSESLMSIHCLPRVPTMAQWKSGTVRRWRGRPPPPGRLHTGGESTHPPSQRVYQALRPWQVLL